MKKLGLIGKNIAYSFSENYFNSKFESENISGYSYSIFDLENITEVNQLKKNKELLGFNVTIPYKKEVIPYLDNLSESAKAIGAVNTVHFYNGKWIGHNTDAIGFKNSLLNFISIDTIKKAYILGTGGASLAVAFALKSLAIDYTKVSRSKTKEAIDYEAFSKIKFNDETLLINSTPIGTFPNIEEKPKLNYANINAKVFAYDLVYNPEETAFMKACKTKGAEVKNGLEMLHGQADAAWDIWTKKIT